MEERTEMTKSGKETKTSDAILLQNVFKTAQKHKAGKTKQMTRTERGFFLEENTSLVIGWSKSRGYW